MNPIEDKVRRRLAPFVVEGKIAAPQFSAASTAAVTVSVQLKAMRAGHAGVEAALQHAMRDLGSDAHLVINPA